MNKLILTEDSQKYQINNKIEKKIKIGFIQEIIVVSIKKKVRKT